MDYHFSLGVSIIFEDIDLKNKKTILGEQIWGWIKQYDPQIPAIFIWNTEFWPFDSTHGELPHSLLKTTNTWGIFPQLFNLSY